MAVTLYFFPTSFYSQKVRFALEEKKIPYTTVLVNLPGGEPHSPWYMKNVNRMGQVPTIKHGEKFLSDSDEIVRYLDRAFGGNPLYPHESTAKGQQIEDFIQLQKKFMVGVLTYGMIAFPELSSGLTFPGFLQRSFRNNVLSINYTKGVERKMDKYPDLKEDYAKKFAMLKAFQGQINDEDHVKFCIESGKVYFNAIEKILEKNAEEGNADFNLFSKDFNLADITLAVTLQRTKFIGLAKCMWEDGKHPYVERYYARLLKRRSFQVVCVEGYSTTTLLKAMIVFKLRRVGKALLFVGAVGLLGYFTWRYFGSTKS